MAPAAQLRSYEGFSAASQPTLDVIRKPATTLRPDLLLLEKDERAARDE